MRQNVKEKCNNCNLPSDLSQNDVFGSRVGDQYVEGLVDATDDDFLDALIMSWRNHSVSS